MDIRTAGPMFCLIADKVADINYSQAFEKLQLFLQILLEGFAVSKTQIEEFVADFVVSLPNDSIQRCRILQIFLNPLLILYSQGHTLHRHGRNLPCE